MVVESCFGAAEVCEVVEVVLVFSFGVLEVCVGAFVVDVVVVVGVRDSGVDDGDGSIDDVGIWRGTNWAP